MAGGTGTYEGARQTSKGEVKAVSLTNVASLSDTGTVGGATITDGQVVLLAAQTTESENGPWVVNADVAWTRPEFWPTAKSDHAANGALFFCSGGTYKGVYFWAHSAGVTVDTTDVVVAMAETFQYTTSLDLVANTTTTSRCKPVTSACTIVGINSKARTAAVSAAGTVTLSVAAGGNNLLSTATVDLETQGATKTALTLTATAADLKLSYGDVIEQDVVSNNADATGGLDIVLEVIAIPTQPA
jgi:hypothetical protein